MPKKRKAKGKSPAKTGEAPQESLLLSLPAEVRRMIWETVINSQIVQLCEDQEYFMTHAYLKPGKLKAIVLPPGPVDERCGSDPNKKSSLTTRSKKYTVPGLLSWLRTNRQIYTEAKPLIQANLNLHFCYDIALAGFLALPPDSHFKLSQIRSISICQKITVASDLRDGFSFARGVPQGVLDHSVTCNRRGVCVWCDNFGSQTASTLVLADRLPALRELRVWIYFECQNGQGNTRPIIGQHSNRQPKRGQLYRPKDPVPMTCTDDEQMVKWFAKVLCAKKRLQIFTTAAKLDFVQVNLHENIKHLPSNRPPHARDKCWCIGRKIDKPALEKLNLASEIEKILKNGGSGKK
ncbi:hypothetical protein F5884DRAFT_854977 [Xylogone sp. PMI_703]|nr:hypothetical protein F5884DRAFT_854977 [Xylogone sp. PMI_703]